MVWSAWIAGGGVQGRVTSFLRSPSAEPPWLDDLAGRVDSRQVAGSSVPVIGDSRGLGEATAKLLAAGGARVMLTYTIGREDAARVAREIRDAGGDCAAMAFDACAPAADQLDGLTQPPTHLYYVATPTDRPPQSGRVRCVPSRPISGLLSSSLLRSASGAAGGLRALYPSTEIIESHPLELTEYVMGKLAGEALCRDITRVMDRLHSDIARLPQVATDQDASMLPMETVSAVAAMVPILTRLHAPA